MTHNLDHNRADRLYRVDRFEVPVQARDEFLKKVQETHELLRAVQGFLQDFLLEQNTEDGIVHIVTIVEWENADAVTQAQQIIKAFREKSQFNPQDLIARLGIKADMRSYSPIAQQNHAI
jgi:heme-degrading monooxygenase HmoA